MFDGKYCRPSLQRTPSQGPASHFIGSILLEKLLCIDVQAFVNQIDGMYGLQEKEWIMFHANDYGRADLSPARARTAKMNLLADVTAIVRGDPSAVSPQKRWPSTH